MTSTSETGGARKLAHFYAGKSVFITGATGFIGKVTLWKLMGAFENCAQVFVLLRAKKGLAPRERLERLLREAPFNAAQMRFEHNPHLAAQRDELRAQMELQMGRIDWSKVVAVEGDMSQADFGLEASVKRELCKKVEVMFNIAASVQFDAPLKQNLRENFQGARNMLELACKLERLVSLVHVSTFYVNSHLAHVEERVLPLSRDCEQLAELILQIPDRLLGQQNTQKLLEGRPNTYIFTKALAENLVVKYERRLPISILRPSIVVCARRDPEPGWVDNVNGPMGLGVLAALGILRNIDWNYWGVCDFVPVDHVANSLLALAERTARVHPKEIRVYNCATSSCHPTTWGRCFKTMREESLKAPPYKMLRIPIQVPKHRRANKLQFALSKLSELLFAHLIDLILVLCGQKRLLVRLTAKLHNGYALLLPFTTTEYTCSTKNYFRAFNELTEADKREFDFDLRSIDWFEGFRNAYYGARKRLLKEDLANVPAALVKMRILMVVEFAFKLACCLALGWAVLKVAPRTLS